MYRCAALIFIRILDILQGLRSNGHIADVSVGGESASETVVQNVNTFAGNPSRTGEVCYPRIASFLFSLGAVNW